MLEVFVLNPGGKRKGKSVAKTKRKKSAYQKFAAKKLKELGGGPKAMKKVAQEWRDKSSGSSKKRRNAVAKKRKNKKRRRRNAWVGQSKRHSAAAKKGWKSRKRRNPKPKRRRRRRNTWAGQPRRHMWARKTGSAKRPKGRVKYSSKRRRRNTSIARRRRNFSPRRHRRNAILPYMAYNPVLPYMAYNQGSIAAQLTAPFKAAITADFWMKEFVPLGGGFLGTAVVSQRINAMLPAQFKPASPLMSGIVDTAVDLGSAGIVSAITGFIAKDRSTTVKVLTGGLIYAGFNILRRILPSTTQATIGLSDAGLGMLPDSTRARIAQVVREDAGVADFLTSQGLMSTVNLADYASTQAIAAGPNLAPAPVSVTDVMDDMDGMDGLY